MTATQILAGRLATLATLRLLLDRGANPEADCGDTTLLSLAVQDGKNEAEVLLCKHMKRPKKIGR